MPEAAIVTKLDLIKLVGNIIIEVDVLRSTFNRDSTERKQLDDKRDQLDTLQRNLVRNMFAENTENFITLSNNLKTVNTNLKSTIIKIEKLAETLVLLNKFIKILTKIVDLVPV